jgi:hypothetical protein
MKDLTAPQLNKLEHIAKKYIFQNEDDFSITPWVVNLFPWNLIAKKPFLYACVIVSVLYGTVLLTNVEKISLHFIIKNLLIALSVWMGLFCAFHFSKVYEKLYFDVRKITILPEDTLKRWFVNNISLLWGFINLRRISERKNYKFRMTWHNDRLIIFQFFFWSIVNGLAACVATRRFNFEFSLGWLFQTIFCFLWAYSFMWTSHYGHSCITFLLKLGRLPIRYCFYMPDSLTFKAIGSRMVGISWITSIHFWLLIGIFHYWEVFKIQEGEQPLVTAIVTTAIAPVVILYFIWQLMTIAITQVALSKTMLEYKNKRLTEFFYHVEEVANRFIANPTDPNFKVVKEKAKYMRLFNKLPVVSMTIPQTLSFLCQLFITMGLLYLFFTHSIGGIEGIKNLLSPIFS